MNDDTRPLSLTARAGLTGKAAFHLVLGLVALSLVDGSSGEQAGGRGAIDALARQPFGRLLLALLAVGLAGYAVFRAWRAVRPADGPDGSVPPWLLRVFSGVRALAYAGLAVLAGRNVVTGQSSGSGGGRDTRATEQLLSMPGGVVLVVAAGLAVAGVGAWFAHQAVREDPLEECDLSGVGAARRRTYAVVGRTGVMGRALSYLLVGGFLVQSALQYDADEGVGLDAALQEVSQSAVGAPMVLLIGGGLVLFAVYTQVLAVHAVVRRMD